MKEGDHRRGAEFAEKRDFTPKVTKSTKFKSVNI
jgi:hypothetical protein